MRSRGRGGGVLAVRLLLLAHTSAGCHSKHDDGLRGKIRGAHLMI